MGKTFNAGKAASALEQVAENKARAAAAAAAQAEQAANDVNTANDGQLTFDVKDAKNVKSAKDVKATKDAKAEIERLKAILADADTGTGAGALAALDAIEQIQQIDKKIKYKSLADRYKPDYERVNLKIPRQYVEYLRAAALRESDTKHLLNLTDIICLLIRKDMENHKDN